MPPKKAAKGKGKRLADSEDEDDYLGSESEAPAPKATTKKKPRQSGGASDAVPVTSLVSRLSRSALEALLVSSIQRGVVTRAEVEELLGPSQARGLAREVAQVSFF